MGLQSGQIGLAIFSSIGLVASFQIGMRQSAELESQMTSVERIVEYAELPSEPHLESSEKDAPSKDWPQRGNIEFKSLSLRYVENGARALRNLTLRIYAKVDEILDSNFIKSPIYISKFIHFRKRLAWLVERELAKAQ